MPKRIQRKRTKGWRMPEGVVYVGRPTKWGNPYESNGSDLLSHELVAMYGAWLNSQPLLRDAAIAHLRGKDLACWCPLVDKNGDPVPCHADVLLEIANREESK